MTRWWEKLRGRPLYGLLSEEEPSVRYLALTRVLERPPTAPAVRQAKAAIAHSATVHFVRDRLHITDGSLVEPRYRALVWTLSLLGTLQADGRDEKIATACDHLLERAPQRGGEFVTTDGRMRSQAVPAAALGLRAIAQFGFAGDERAGALLRAMIRRLRMKPGACPHGETESQQCPDCAVLALAAIAAWPESLLPAAAADWRNEAVAWMTDIRLADLPTRWMAFAFPTFDQPDLLFACRILVDLGFAGNARAAKWAAFVVEAQDESGRWHASRSVTNHDWPVFTAHVTEQWITWQALQVIRATYGE